MTTSRPPLAILAAFLATLGLIQLAYCGSSGIGDVAILENAAPYSYRGTNQFRYTTQYDIGTIRFVATRRDGNGKFLGYFQKCRPPVPPLDYISLCSPSGYVFCPLVVTPCDYARDVTYFFLIDNPLSDNYGLSVFDNQILPMELTIDGPDVEVPLEFSQSHYYSFRVNSSLTGATVTLLVTPESNATHPIEVYVSNSPTHKNCYKWMCSTSKAGVCSASLVVGQPGFLPGLYYVAITPLEAPIVPTQFYTIEVNSANNPPVTPVPLGVTKINSPVHGSSYLSLTPSLSETTMTAISIRNADTTYLGDTELNVGTSKYVSRQTSNQQCIETDRQGTCNLNLEPCERQSPMYATLSPIANYKFDFNIDVNVNITETNYSVANLAWDTEYTITEPYVYYKLPAVTGITARAINLHFYNITNTRVSAIFSRRGVSDGGSCMDSKPVCPTRSIECYATQLICSYRSPTGNLYISLRAPPSILTSPISYKFTASLNNSRPLASGEVSPRVLFTNEAHVYDLPSSTAPVEFTVTVTENTTFPSLQLSLLNQSITGCGLAETSVKCQASPTCSLTLLCPSPSPRQVRVLNSISVTQAYNVSSTIISPTPLTDTVNMSVTGKQWFSFNLTTPKSFRIVITPSSSVTYELFQQCSRISEGSCTAATGCTVTLTDANVITFGSYYLSIGGSANVSVTLSFGQCADITSSLTFCKNYVAAPFTYPTWLNFNVSESKASADFTFLDSIYLANCTETVRKVACAANLRKCDSNGLESAFCEEDCLDLMCGGCFASECAEEICSRFPKCNKARNCTFQQRPIPPRPPTPTPTPIPTPVATRPPSIIMPPETDAAIVPLLSGIAISVPLMIVTAHYLRIQFEAIQQHYSPLPRPPT